jgi:enoyl-CoA hydratase/carnithine racemase
MTHVRYEVRDRIATITLDRAEKRNAMTYAMLGEFIETVERAGADDAAQVVILTGSGGSFCAGTDLSDLATVPGERRGCAARRRTRAAGGRWSPARSR